MKKVLYVVLDGLGDRPVPQLGGRTPLEAAAAPFLGALTLDGETGLVQTVGKGIAPESDVAVMAILGYDPFTYHTGRGVFEVVGSGMAFQDGNLALRGNFATGDGRTILDRRAGRDLASEDAHALAEALTREIRLTRAPAELEVRASIGHRAAVAIRRRDGRLSAKISNTDPAYGRVGGGLGVAKAVVGNQVERCEPLEDTEEARTAAALVNEFTQRAQEVLDRQPANARRRERGRPPANLLLVRDAGDHLPKLPAIAERFGLRFGCFVEMPVERGIAELSGMTVIAVPPSGTDKERVYTEWARTAVREYPRHDGLYMHLKGPDEPGHDGDWRGKTEIIETIDRSFFGTLLGEVSLDDAVIAVTADHATPATLGRHSDDPVPLLVAGAGVRPDGSRVFNEAACARGGLGTLAGTDIMPLLARLAGGA